ncbi:MAG: hypothetical protein ACW99A_08030 [Candidatus Kariarchaeaceae archaeon]|jgi:hypothetical protein
MRAEIPIPRSVSASERAWGLPAGTIRFIIILIFGAGIYILIVQKDRDSLPPYYFEVVYSVIGYNLGMIYTRIRRKLFPNPKVHASLLDHLKSLAFLILTGITIFYTVDSPKADITENLIYGATILLGFYFGVRDEKPKTVESQT